MKKLLATLLIIVLAATLLFYVPVMAKLAPVPHEDPATAQSSIGARSVLRYYGDVLALVLEKEYESAEDLIQRLKYAQVPEEYRYIIDRYNDLVRELSGVLDNVDEVLGEASSLIAQYRLDEAAARLEEAQVLIGRVEVLLGDIEDATETVASRLGVSAAPAESKVREAYDRLQASVDRLWKLKEELARLQGSLGGEVAAVEEKELQPTAITLELSPMAAFVGEVIMAKGALTVEEDLLRDVEQEPLLNRGITILLDGEPVATASTGFYGLFLAEVPIPFSYVPEMMVEARYMPLDADRDEYLPCISPSREMEVMFYRTELETEAPDEAYPGRPLVVGGEIAWEGEEAPGWRDVKVLLDDDLWATLSTPEGRFEVEVIPDPGVSLGEHTLTVAVEPQGLFANASQEMALNIVTVSPQIDVDAPTFVALPGTIHVSGRVLSPFPLEEARVSLGLGQASTEVETLEQGQFSASLGLGLDLVFVGLQELVVEVEPIEPWHSPVEARVKVFVINLTNIGLILAAAASLGVLLHTRRRGRPGKGEAPPPEAPPVAERLAEAAPRAKPGAKLEGIKGRLLEAYMRAADVVEEATRVRMEPHMTLREFLMGTTPMMYGAVEAFAKLTALAERALYSSHAPEVEEAVEAEKLALEVEEVIRGGVA